MGTNFPTALDSFTNPTASGSMLGPTATGHAGQHDDLNDAVTQLEKVAIGPIHINARAYGATGDGANGTDDTTAINNALAAATVGQIVYLPTPTSYYKITGTLNFPDVRGVRLMGSSKNSCEIRMFTNNLPIIKTSGTFQRSYQISELHLSYSSQQNFASHPLSACIRIDSATASSACYYSTFSGLYLEKATWGILSNNVLSVWGCTFDDIQCGAIEHSVITLIPSPAVGQPVNRIRGVRSLAEGGPVTTGVALDILNEVVMEAIDIEDWTGLAIQIANGPFTINGVHFERHVAANNVGCIAVAGIGTIMGVELSGNAANGVTGIVYSLTGQVTVDRCRLDLTQAGTGQWVYVIAGATSTCDLAYPFVNTGTLTYFMYPGSANTTAAVRVNKGGTGGVQTVTSAGTITLTDFGTVFTISGTTTITSVTASWAERRVTLIFSGALTFTDGSNLKLAGNFVTTADDSITLVCDGTNWYETSRSVN